MPTATSSPTPTRFPSGIKALADYIHSKGLKFGIYTDVGTKTCAGRPGSIGHEYQDARQYAAWGVDYLKEDWCNTLPGQNAESSYTLMRDALAATGRPIVFSLCEWGSNKPWLWAGPIGNLWRATGDIQDCWDCKKQWGGNGVVQIIDLMDGLESYAGPGHWNDPDMLGSRQRRHDHRGVPRPLQHVGAALPRRCWSATTSPTCPPTRESILLNKEVIAIDQDPLGIQGHRVKKRRRPRGLVQAARRWRPRRRSAQSQRRPGLDHRRLDRHRLPRWAHATVRDLWTQEESAPVKGSYTAEVPSHGVVMLRVKP